MKDEGKYKNGETALGVINVEVILKAEEIDHIGEGERERKN